MKFTPQDKSFMEQALQLARKGEGKVHPNPMVGALVVKDGRIVGRGAHEKFGGPHAEVIALNESGRHSQGATLYITLEPCVAFDGKKTPPCADRVARSGVARVVVASTDPNPRVSGRGLAALRKAKIRADAGLLAEQNEQLNRAFFKRQTAGLPYVICKWAMSLDGKIATRSGDSKWITSATAREIGRELRSRCGAVLVGSGTVLADNPRLERVARVVLDSMARTPVSSNIIRTARKWRTLLAVSPDCPEERVKALRRAGAEVHKFEVMDLPTILARFCAMGVDRVLIEGGGEVHASALQARIVDEAVAFIAPIVVGGRQAKTPVEGDGIDRLAQALKFKEVVTRTLPTREIMVHGWL